MKYLLSILAVLVAISSPAEARKRHRHVQPQVQEFNLFGFNTGMNEATTATSKARSSYGPKATYARHSDGIGPRPGRVCGWLMQRKTGVTSASTGINLNLARNWRYVGSPGNYSAGEIFSQHGHVSMIVGPGRRPGTVSTVSERRNGSLYYVDRSRHSGVARRI